MHARKNLVVAALVGLAAPVQAGFFDGSTDFEGANPLSDACWGNVGDAAVVVDASVAVAPRAAALPPSFDETSRTNVLAVDTSDPIVRYLQADKAAPSASTIYADALVRGCPVSAEAPVPEAGTDEKILVYTRVSQNGDATNLCVYAKDSANGTAQEFVLTTTIGDDEWHRLVIKATADGYQVYCDGTDATNLCKTPGDVDTFYALNAGDPMTSLAFIGEGYVDDIILSDFDPSKSILAWGAGFESVSYTVNGQPGDSLTMADGEALIEAAVGDTIVLSGFTGYRTVSNVCTVASLPVTLELPGLTGIARYFPQSATAGQDGTAEHPYEIPDLAALKALQAAVAVTTNCADICFLQTADIALDAPWPGIGIQNGKDLATGKTAEEVEAFDDGAFRGTYDGGNFTVSNFQMVGVAGNPASETEGLDYCGFFNSTYQATICNLKISYAGGLFAADTTASTKESGATFVGVAKNSTLRNLTALAGTVSCSKGFGGISGYTTGGTVIDSCTNNVNMTSLAGNKCGGIAMITQTGEAVTITNCQNTGTMTTESATSEYGGIVGYVGLNTTIADCETTVGRFLKHQNNTVTLQGVNKGDANVASYQGAATPGLNFATVDGDVATFVTNDVLAAGSTYKVMATNVTATYAFSAPGTIAFDETLFAPTYAITAPDLALTEATEGTVRTYTATRNPIVFVTTYGVTVTGVENGQRVVPGTNLLLSVSGFAEGYTPSVRIMKHEDHSELLTTNAVSFTYTMPDFDIDVVADATPPSYNDPEGYEIQDQGLIDWLLDNGFTQGDINDLGKDAAATDKLYECWLLNCSITAENPGGTIHTTGIAVTNGVVSITVRLVRQSPLGFITGVLHLYGTDDLADDFSLISEEIVGFSEGDSIFDTDPAEGAVSQSVTATFSLTDVTATFFQAKIEFPLPPDEPEDPGEPEETEEP